VLQAIHNIAQIFSMDGISLKMVLTYLL